jgi:hypothetical protein
VLDIDGDEGESELRKLEAQHGALPATVEAITGKGRHIYFRYPTGTNIRNRQAFVAGIDVRGNGGYVLCPPSVHPSGKVYAWSVDSGGEFEDAPEWLIDLVVRGGGNGGQPMSPDAWGTFFDEHVEGSRRGAGIARYYGLLLSESNRISIGSALRRNMRSGKQLAGNAGNRSAPLRARPGEHYLAEWRSTARHTDAKRAPREPAPLAPFQWRTNGADVLRHY